jgi:glutathione S-transferase
MYRLHGFCQSGSTFKVAFALRAMNQPWEAALVDFMNGATRQEGWRESLNEMGEAPVLEGGTLAPGRRLTQSGAILTYLARLHGAFSGKTDDEQQEVLRWILFDNHKFTSYMATYRFMKAFGPAAPDPIVMAFLRSRMDAAFAIVNKHLAASDFMVGNAPTIADFSLCGYLYYPVEESSYEVQERFPYIGAWLNRLREVPGWALPYDILPGERIAPKW